MSALHWLAQRDDGLGNLPASDQREIMEFSLLWSYFEARFLNENANPKTIREFVADLDQRGLIQVDALLALLAYFRDRYVRNDRLTDQFNGLHLRDNDNVQIVKDVLLGYEASASGVLICCLTIVLRYRNNLFHGLKWAYGLQGQKGNFQVANKILIATAEMTRGPQ